MTAFLVALATGVGLVLVVEGLVFVALPRRLDAILELVARMPMATRRRIGLGMIATGVMVVWLGRSALG